LRRLRTARFISEVYDSENGTDGTDPFPQSVPHPWRVGLPFYPSGLESEAAPPLRFLQGWGGTRQGLPTLGLFACGGSCAPSLASGLREINSAGFIDGNWTRLRHKLSVESCSRTMVSGATPKASPTLAKSARVGQPKCGTSRERVGQPPGCPTLRSFRNVGFALTITASREKQ
jgi:hypothetical protein